MSIKVKNLNGDATSFTEQDSIDTDMAAIGGYEITQSNTVNEARPFRSLFFGGSTAQTIQIVTIDGSVLSFTNVQPGSIIPVQGKRVNDSATTANNSDMIALY